MKLETKGNNALKNLELEAAKNFYKASIEKNETHDAELLEACIEKIEKTKKGELYAVRCFSCEEVMFLEPWQVSQEKEHMVISTLSYCVCCGTELFPGEVFQRDAEGYSFKLSSDVLKNLKIFKKTEERFTEASINLIHVSKNTTDFNDMILLSASSGFDMLAGIKALTENLEEVFIDALIQTRPEEALEKIERRIAEETLRSCLNQKDWDNRNKEEDEDDEEANLICCYEWDWMFKKAFLLKSLGRYEEALKTFQELETKQKEMGDRFETHFYDNEKNQKETKTIQENITELKALINK